MALFLVLGAKTAWAAPSQRTLGESIHVRRGVTCIDQAALLEQVRSWLDADTVDAELRVDVEGDGLDERLVTIRMWREGRLIAERRFAPGPAQCAEMHAVVGLAIALALKVSLRDELLGEAVPAPEHPWSLGAAALAAWDVVPGAAAGLALWVERALPEHFSARLGVSGLLGQSTRFERVAGTFTTSSLALEAGACAVPTLGGPVKGRFCAGLEVRTLFASGSGFSVSKDALLDWFSVSNSVGVSVALGARWSLIGSVGVLVPLERVQILVVEPDGRAVESRDAAPASGFLSLGGAYEF